MKKNGFTLIELIGVVVIIALILLVTIPKVMSTMTNSTENKIKSFEHDLELSASSYIEENWSDFKDSYETKKIDGKYCINLQTLIDDNYLKATEIDPSTDKVIDPSNKYILIDNISDNKDIGMHRFSFTYVDTTIDTSSICNGWSGK